MKKFVFMPLFALITTSLLAAAPNHTALPAAREKYVNDFANVIKPADAEQIRALLKSTEERTQVEVTVVTVNRMADFQPGSTIEQFAGNLFNHWGVGKRRTNSGIMLLLSLQDRQLRIQLGSGYDADLKRFEAAAQHIITHSLKPLCSQEKYSEALLAGATAITKTIATANPASTPASPVSKILRFLFWGTLLALAGSILWVIRHLGRKEQPQVDPVTGRHIYRPTNQTSNTPFGGGRSGGGGASGGW